MKEENEITQEVKELLESLEQHGQNARRQKELSDLIDSLAAGTSLRAERRRPYPIWWIVGAAAACLLLWLLAKPAMEETPNMNEEILVEQTDGKDTTKTQEDYNFVEESIFLEEPIAKEELAAQETPIKLKKPKNQSVKPNDKPVENTIDETLLAENSIIESTKPETSDTSIIGSSTKPSLEEEKLSPLTSQLSTPSSPQRRVIRSLNLVCYECQKEPEYTSHLSPLTSHLDNTIFGQPQDPNIKNGSLAFEVKLH